METSVALCVRIEKKGNWRMEIGKWKLEDGKAKGIRQKAKVASGE